MRDILSLSTTCIFATHRSDIAALADRVLTLDADGWRIRAATRSRPVDCAEG
jgi:ABC-type lipoprotein export system ATPase subunit